MPIIFLCHKCGQKLQSPDELAGKPIRCGKCAAVIAVPASAAVSPVAAQIAPVSTSHPISARVTAPPPPPPTPLPEESITSPAHVAAGDGLRRPPFAPAWSFVRRGLSCHVVGYTILFIKSLLWPVGMLAIAFLFAAGGGDGPPIRDEETLILVAVGIAVPVLLVWLTAVGFVIVGDCLNCAAPDMHCKILAIARLCCLVSGFLLNILHLILVVALSFLFQRPPEWLAILNVLLILLFTAIFFGANILYLLLLRKVAAFFHADKLARGVLWYLGYWLGLIVVMIFSIPVVVVAAYLIPRDFAVEGMFVLFACWFLVAAVGIYVMFAWLISLIRRIRNTVRKAMAS